MLFPGDDATVDGNKEGSQGMSLAFGLCNRDTTFAGRFGEVAADLGGFLGLLGNPAWKHATSD